MSKQLKSDQQEPRYADVVHHANVKASVSYVQRKTGLSFNETSRLLELALQRGDLKYGDYAGRRLENYVDDKTDALKARIAELEAQLARKVGLADYLMQKDAVIVTRKTYEAMRGLATLRKVDA